MPRYSVPFSLLCMRWMPKTKLISLEYLLLASPYSPSRFKSMCFVHVVTKWVCHVLRLLCNMFFAGMAIFSPCSGGKNCEPFVEPLNSRFFSSGVRFKRPEGKSIVDRNFSLLLSSAVRMHINREDTTKQGKQLKTCTFRLLQPSEETADENASLLIWI